MKLLRLRPHVRVGTAVRLVVVLACAALAASVPAEQVRVAHKQGDVHGFLILRDADGKQIAAGDQTYQVRGGFIRSRTVFRFRDGSIDEEETTFRQGSLFRLIRDHHIQKGPSFPQPMDLTIDAVHGVVSWKDLSKSDLSKPSLSKDLSKDLSKLDLSKLGLSKPDSSKNDASTTSHRMKLPPDLANGILPLLVQNFPAGAQSLTVSFVAFDGKPRLVRMAISPDGTDKVILGQEGLQAQRFKIHMDIGGLAGLVAPLVGKQPPDLHLWIAGGLVPVFLRLEGPLYADGPVWNLLFAAPSWPEDPASGAAH